MADQDLRESLALDQLAIGTRGEIVRVDWEALGTSDARRLRNFGFAEGVSIMCLHDGPFGRDPVAYRVGRMTVAIRRAHAAMVQVRPA